MAPGNDAKIVEHVLSLMQTTLLMNNPHLPSVKDFMDAYASGLSSGNDSLEELLIQGE